MRCVAVLDLRAGVVVHAVRGQRDRYQPIRSVLTPAVTAEGVADALRERLAIDAFYVADLDAIQQQGSSRITIEALIRRHPDCDWWIDAGVGVPDALESYLSLPRVSCVIGSETVASVDDYRAVRNALPRPDAALLSLDHRAGRFMGPAALASDAALWPGTVIAMNLDRVGAGGGPDLGLIRRLRDISPSAAIVAAGGVRDAADLATLVSVGVSHVLLATALHQGHLGAAELAACA
jgi:phosphoribosylformimino-5-aminoimidazole carboxamide ribotide isomerase